MNSPSQLLVTISKQELEKIQMSLTPAANRRARDCPSPILSHDAHDSDNDEEDQSYVGLHSTLRVTVKTHQDGMDSGVDNLSFPPYRRKRGESQGLSRRGVIRRNRTQGSRRGNPMRGSPGLEDASVSQNSGTAGVLPATQLQGPHPLYIRHSSRENTPQIVIESPTPDTSHSSAHRSSYPQADIGAEQSSKDPATTPAPGAPPKGNISEPVPSASTPQGSPSHEGPDRGDFVDGLQSLRRSRVISGRSRMLHSKNTDELGMTSPSHSLVPRFGETENVATPTRQQDFGVSGDPFVETFKPSPASVMQGEDEDFKRTRPCPQAAIDPAGKNNASLVSASGDDVVTSVGGGGGVTGGLVMDSEFKKVKVTSSHKAGGPDLAGKESMNSKAAEEDDEFRKVKIHPTLKYQTAYDTGGPEEFGKDFKKGGASTPSPWSSLDLNAPSGLEEEFKKVKASAPNQGQCSRDDEFTKVVVGSEGPAEIKITAQQLSDAKVEPQAQASNPGKTEKEEPALPAPPLTVGVPSQSNPSLPAPPSTVGVPSPASLSHGLTSEDAPFTQKIATRRKVISSYQPDKSTAMNDGDGDQAHLLELNGLPHSSTLGTGGPVNTKDEKGDVQPTIGGALSMHENVPVEDTPVIVTHEHLEPIEGGGDLANSQETDEGPTDGEQRVSGRQRHQWKRRQAMSRRGRHNDDGDDNQELGPRSRTKAFSVSSHDNAPLN